MHVISLVNKKGGVGKTTIASYLGQGLAIIGKRVLLIDNDPQCNLSSQMGVAIKNCDSTLYDIMKASSSKLNTVAEDSIYTTVIADLDIIPGSESLESVGNLRVSFFQELLSTKSILSEKYDYVIIDNPPGARDKSMQSVIMCTNHFIVPVEPRQYSLDGLRQMYAYLTENCKVPSDCIYIVRNRYRRCAAHDKLGYTINELFPDNVVSTIIPDDIALDSFAGNHHKTAFYSKTRAVGTLCFQQLICELFAETDADEDEMLDKFKLSLQNYRANVARKNLKKARIINLSIKGGNK